MSELSQGSYTSVFMLKCVAFISHLCLWAWLLGICWVTLTEIALYSVLLHIRSCGPPSCTVTVNLSASPGRWSLGPLHGPRAQPLPVTRPSILKPGVASPAPGSSRWQGPAQCAGCERVGFRGLQYGKCCCGLFLLFPPPPPRPPEEPLLLLSFRPARVSWHLFGNLPLLCLCQFPRKDDITARKGTLVWNSGRLGSILHYFFLIMKVMWDPCRISPEVSRGIHASCQESSARDRQSSVLLTSTCLRLWGRKSRAEVPRCPQGSVRADLPITLLHCSPLPSLAGEVQVTVEKAPLDLTLHITFPCWFSCFQSDNIPISIIAAVIGPLSLAIPEDTELWEARRKGVMWSFQVPVPVLCPP